MSSVFKTPAAGEAVHRAYRSYLARWPVSNEQLHVPTREGATFVVASGPEDGTPIVLLHGTMAMSAMWMREVSILAADYRVYAIDIIGDAGLSAPVRPPLSTEAHALWLDDVFAELGLTSASLVGLSFGGWLALDYAIRRPGQVSALVLMTPGGIADRNVIVWALPLLLLGSWGARQVRNRIVGKIRTSRSVEANQFAEFADSVYKAMRPRTERLPNFSDGELAELTMPVLVLLGEHDVTMDSHRIKNRIERHVEKSEVVIMPNARHYLGDQSSSIMDFLKRRVRARQVGRD